MPDNTQKPEAFYPFGTGVIKVERGWLAFVLRLSRRHKHKIAASRIFKLNTGMRKAAVGEIVNW